MGRLPNIAGHYLTPIGTKAAAGAYGSTAVTFASTGINVGMAIALQP